jgi:hypothetical protein
MTEQNPAAADLRRGRSWLDLAAELFDKHSVEEAHAAATIGHGYVALAHASQSLDSMAATARRRALFDSAAEREQRAQAEARPHDDESCTFVHDGQQCVYELVQGEHAYHRLPDGREVDDRGELAPQETDRG